MVQNIKSVLLCLFGCYALFEMGVLFHSSAVAVSEFPHQVELTRDTIAGKFDRIITIAENLPDQVVPPVLQEVRHQGDRITDKADNRLASIQGDARDVTFLLASSADHRVGEATEQLKAAADAVVALERDLHPILADSASITHQANDVLPLFLDCDHNPDCAFSRFQGTAKAFEKMAQAGANAAPQLAAAAVSTATSGASIAAAVEREADALTKPQSTRQKIMAWLNLIPRLGLKLL